MTTALWKCETSSYFRLILSGDLLAVISLIYLMINDYSGLLKIHSDKSTTERNSMIDCELIDMGTSTQLLRFNCKCYSNKITISKPQFFLKNLT